MTLLRSPQWLLALFVVLLSGCQTLPERMPTQPPIDQGNVPPSAQHSTAKSVVSALVNAPNVAHITAKTQPILLVDRLVNRTADHIDTQALTQAIHTELKKSQQFRLLDIEQVQALRQRLDYLSHNGLIDPAKAVEFGRQAGAQYLLYGQITGAAPYRMVLRLMDLDTGLIEWSMQKNSVN